MGAETPEERRARLQSLISSLEETERQARETCQAHPVCLDIPYPGEGSTALYRNGWDPGHDRALAKAKRRSRLAAAVLAGRIFDMPRA